MRSIFIALFCAALVVAAAGAAPRLDAAPQKAAPSEEAAGPPIHAVLVIHGKSLPTDGVCSPHGVHIVWEGDLVECDDDPGGIYPCASYTGSGPFTTLRFDDFVCRQEGVYDIRIKHKYGSAAEASVDLILVHETDDGSFDRSIRFVFRGWDIGYEISSDGGRGSLDFDFSWEENSLSPPLRFVRGDFERGFERTYRTTRGTMDDSGEGASDFKLGFCGGEDYDLEATLTLSYKQDTKKPKVEIAGCAHLIPGSSKELTATGTPSGGKYRWSAEPSSVLDVSGSESTASVRAAKPGRATVRVEYEAKNGKKAEATLPGSVVTLTSVNGGAPIPAIYLHDAYGKSTATIEVPTAQDPPDGDLLGFVVADPAVATVTSLGSSIVIQGVSAGTTSAQARTQCGEMIGPVIAIEVAGCDPGSIARLRDQYKKVRNELDESIQRVNKVLTSKDFIESSDGIKGDIINAAVEAADLAASGMANAKAASAAVKTAHEVIEAGSLGWDLYRDGAKATLIKAGVAVLVPGGAGLVSVYDKATAFGKLAKDITVLADADERIAREQPIQDGYMKELEQIDKLIDKCKKEGGGEPPPGEPEQPARPKPRQPKGKPGGEKPGGDKPAPGEPTTPSQPGGAEPNAGEAQTPAEPPIVEPPTPPAKTGGGGTVGLPIECGCKSSSTAAWRDERSGLAAIAASLSLLQQCAENYGSELERFQRDSASIVLAARAVESALATPGEKGFKLFEAAIPGLASATNSLERLSKAAGDFKSSLEGCEQKMPEAVELVKKAGATLGTAPPGLAKPK